MFTGVTPRSGISWAGPRWVSLGWPRDSLGQPRETLGQPRSDPGPAQGIPEPGVTRVNTKFLGDATPQAELPALAHPGVDAWVTNAQGKFIFDFATIGLGA